MSNSVHLITDHQFGPIAKPSLTVQNSLVITLGGFLIFQLYPHFNPGVGVPEIHISWLIFLFMLFKTALLLNGANRFLLSPRKITLCSLLPISYWQRKESVTLFWKRTQKETLIFGSVSVIAGTAMNFAIPTSKLLSMETLFFLGVPLLIAGFQEILKRSVGKAEQFIAKKDPKTNGVQGGTLLRNTRTKLSAAGLSVSEWVVKPLKTPVVKLAVRHQLHSLIYDSKLFLFMLFLGLPITTALLLTLFPDLFQNWITATILASFATITLFLAEPFQHSFQKLKTIPSFALREKDILKGNRYVTALLFVPQLLVFLFAVNRGSVIETIVQVGALILAFGVLLIWNRQQIRVTTDSYQGVQLILLWIFCIALDAGVERISTVIS